MIEWNINWWSIGVGHLNPVLSLETWGYLREHVSENTKSEIKIGHSRVNWLDKHIKVAWVFGGLKEYTQNTTSFKKIVKVQVSTEDISSHLIDLFSYSKSFMHALSTSSINVGLCCSNSSKIKISNDGSIILSLNTGYKHGNNNK